MHNKYVHHMHTQVNNIKLSPIKKFKHVKFILIILFIFTS
jgi:hypothetical protein